MKRTRASPSPLNPKVTLYSLLPPAAAAASSTASSSSLPPPPSSTSSSASTSTHFDTNRPRRKSTLLASSRSYKEEDGDDNQVKDEPPSDDDFLDEAPPPSSSSALPPTRPSSSSNKKPKLSSPVKRAPSTSTPWKAPPEPPNWRAQVDAIREMRKDLVAPVDDMGCAAAGRLESDPVKARLSVLISLMLSSQTRDEMTHRAMGKLREALPGGLSAQSLAEADDEVIKSAISSVGFANRKTIYIKDAARDVLEKHGGEIPATIEGLLALKGVGPKMGYLVMEHAWNQSSGIGVDIHVERITNRLGWHPKKTNVPSPTPELARKNLESWLPNSLWREINPLLVGFGQLICSAPLPKCSICTLGPQGLCPSYDPSAKARAEAKAKRDSASPVKGGRKVVKVEVEVEAEIDEAAPLDGTVVWKEEVKRERDE